MKTKLHRPFGWLILAAIGIGLAGCGSSKPKEPKMTEDPCNAKSYTHLIGTNAKELDMTQFPKGTRLLYPTTPTTRDYRIDRLNIHADKDGKILRLDCN